MNFLELTHPDYPNERLVACRNPLLAIERARKREALLSSSEAAVAPIIARVRSGRLKGRDEIALRLGKVLNRFKMEKHFVTDIADDRLVVVRDEDSIKAEAALDGIYVLRTTIGRDELDAAGVISAYKDLAGVERDFRSMKVIDVELRPVHHRLEDRVRSHAFICMLSTYLSFHLRRSLAPLTFTDTEPPARETRLRPHLFPRPPARRPRRRRMPKAKRCAAFVNCSSTSGPLPATACASPRDRRSSSISSRRRRQPSDESSSSSACRSQSASCSQNYLVRRRELPGKWAGACFVESKFGLGKNSHSNGLGPPVTSGFIVVLGNPLAAWPYTSAHNL